MSGYAHGALQGLRELRTGDVCQWEAAGEDLTVRTDSDPGRIMSEICRREKSNYGTRKKKNSLLLPDL